MRTLHTTRRRIVAAVTIALTGILLLGSVPVSSGAASGGDDRVGRRLQMLGLTNQDRDARDREELNLARVLSRYAKRHSEQMANKGYIYHSTETELRKALEGYNWSIGGENVGVGGSLESLEEAFMASKLHRQNILRPAFQRAAVGVVRDGDRFWVTVIFYG